MLPESISKQMWAFYFICVICLNKLRCLIIAKNALRVCVCVCVAIETIDDFFPSEVETEKCYKNQRLYISLIQ